MAIMLSTWNEETVPRSLLSSSSCCSMRSLAILRRLLYLVFASRSFVNWAATLLVADGADTKPSISPDFNSAMALFRKNHNCCIVQSVWIDNSTPSSIDTRGGNSDRFAFFWSLSASRNLEASNISRYLGIHSMMIGESLQPCTKSKPEHSCHHIPKFTPAFFRFQTCLANLAYIHFDCL